MLSDGTSQLDRQTPALYPGFFNLDELSFADLLASAAHYSRLLQFFNLENEPERDWEPFFTSDETIILALILTTNLAQIEFEFLGGLDRSIFRFGPDYDLNSLANYGLARRIDFWMTQLQLSERAIAGSLERQISDAVVTNLRHELLSLGAFFHQYAIADVEGQLRQDFSRTWFSPGSIDWSNYAVPPPSPYPDRIERFLRRNFHSFSNTIRSLQSLSASLMPDSLTSGNHAPDTGLYIAFLRLFQEAQSKANQFTQNHLNFYYQEVLRTRSRPSTPDNAYLVLSTDVPERQVLIREGTEFTAGVDADNQYIIYTADSDVLIHGAQVDELCTLYFERDPLISPEHEMDFASGAKTNRIPVAGDASEPDTGGTAAWPLFGASKFDAIEEPGEEAHLGIALASPVLFLEEGHRSVTINFEVAFQDYRPFTENDLRDPAGLATSLQQPTDPLSQYLREQFSPEVLDLVDAYDPVTSPSSGLFQALVSELNRLLPGDSLYEPQRFRQVDLRQRTRELLQADLSDLDRLRLNRALLEEAYPAILAQTIDLDSLLNRLADLLQDSSPQDAFFKTFRQMFTIHLSTANGWYQVPEYLPLSRVVDDQCPEGTLRIQFPLPPEAPAVVGYTPELHTGAYDTNLPVVRFAVNPGAYMYPYSLLLQMQIREIEIEVEVEGIRELVLANNLGTLDPSNPFNPFGPLPSLGSYLVIGSAEAARKQLTHFDIEVEWGNLPTSGQDFSEYYQAYEMNFANYMFEARVSALQDGRWQPADPTRQELVKLFQSSEEDAADAGSGWQSIKYIRWSVGDTAANFFSPAGVAAIEGGLPYSTLAKNGFFKLTLSSPEYAFGHQDYPLQLTNVLSRNAMLKRVNQLLPIPNPPYTPLINSISVNYRAATSFNLSQGGAFTGNTAAQKIFHLHPFGMETISTSDYRDLDIVPHYTAAGNLFIGLTASSLGGPLTLFFHLQEDCFPEAASEYLGINWYYLASNQWHQLQRSQVISDTTSGFLTSGVVTLNLPRDINRDNTIMPGDRYWLRASVNRRPEALCSLYSVHAQSLKVTRQLSEQVVSTEPQRLPPGTINDSRVSIPGISGIAQIAESFGGSPPETFNRTISRISERLRHKNRAVTPWDYERLILENFPEI